MSSLDELARTTHGFVGADVAALAREAAIEAVRRIMPQLDLEAQTIPAEVLESLSVTREDFLTALKRVQPSAMREVMVQVPNVGWADVGGLGEAQMKLKEGVELPLRNPEAFRRLGIRPAKGFLLYGPPGTGKTLLAKAVAKEAEANFISVKSSDLLSQNGTARASSSYRVCSPARGRWHPASSSLMRSTAWSRRAAPATPASRR